MHTKKVTRTGVMMLAASAMVMGEAAAQGEQASRDIDLGAGVAITAEALTSSAFQQLLTLKVTEPDIGPRISHRIERVELAPPGRRPVLSAEMPMPEERMNVRVVYNGFLPNETPIDFDKDN